jgi:hypothetical protein
VRPSPSPSFSTIIVENEPESAPRHRQKQGIHEPDGEIRIFPHSEAFIDSPRGRTSSTNQQDRLRTGGILPKTSSTRFASTRRIILPEHLGVFDVDELLLKCEITRIAACISPHAIIGGMNGQSTHTDTKARATR